MAKLKTALITGSHGFVGQHLIKALEKKGIIALRFPRNLLNDPKAEQFILEANPDCIFHLAAAGNIYGEHDDAEMIMSNTFAIYNLLQASRQTKATIVNISSSSVLLPHQTIYSATKAAGEKICKGFADTYGMSVVSVRPFTLYGPGDNEKHLIPTLFRSCSQGEGMKFAHNPVHDYVYIEDFINIIIEIATKHHSGEVFHVGAGAGLTNQQVLEIVEGITGRKANLIDIMTPRHYDTTQWYATNELENIRFAQTNLRDGLQRIYELGKLSKE